MATTKKKRTYSLTPDLIERLERLAERGQRPVSRQLAILLEYAIDYAEKHEKAVEQNHRAGY